MASPDSADLDDGPVEVRTFCHRPIVVTDKGAALCRPPERVEALL